MSGSPAATRAPARVARSALTAQLSERLDAAVTPPCPSPNTLSTRALSHGSAHSLARNSLARNSLPRNSLPRNSPRNMRRQVEARRKNAVARSDPIPIASAAPHPQHAAMSFLSVAASVTSGASLECARGVYEEGDQIADYSLLKEIGHGSFSRVFSAIDNNTSHPFAIKILRMQENDATFSNQASPTQSFLDGSMDSLQIQGRINIPTTSTATSRAPRSYMTSPPGSSSSSIYSISFDESRSLMDKETRIWASLDHPHILSMYEVMELDDALCIVSELAQGGSLLSFLAQRGALPEPLARALFAQVAGAVHYMHAVARVVHRDIKCENILVLEDWKANAGFARSDQDTSEWTPTLKLADFGLSDWIGQEPHVPGASRSLASPSAESFGVGSLHYCAPEDLKGCKARATGEASDVWALGCVLFAMVTGGLPFNDGFLPRLQMTIVNGTYDAARLDAVGASAGLKELVKRVFEVDVEDRCTMEDMMGCEWMKGGLW